MAAGISPEQTAENWAAVRSMGRRYMLAVCIALALAMYAVGAAKGRLSGYLEGRAATCPQASPSLPRAPIRN